MTGEPDRLKWKTTNEWAGAFGDDYTARNWHAGEGRDVFWSDLLARYPRTHPILEIGCNVGANLRWTGGWGVDVNLQAVMQAAKLPGVIALWASGTALPFPAEWADLVFTSGVLIHQKDPLPMMREAIRVSRRYVLAIEYAATRTTEVKYRGEWGRLWKRNFGKMYADMGLRMLDTDFLGRPAWDDMTYWLMEK